jgi:hypothetical protein
MVIYVNAFNILFQSFAVLIVRVDILFAEPTTYAATLVRNKFLVYFILFTSCQFSHSLLFEALLSMLSKHQYA